MTEPERAALAEQYATADNLDARVRLHEQYEVADSDWFQWVFDRYDLPADAAVLEVGCGPGYLWRDVADRVPPGWNLGLTDFSAGMVAEARETLAAAGVDASFGVAAAESLPLPDESVDAVVANHMLYHVDRDRALPEIRRVLRPGGRLYATTNGESNLDELHALLDAAFDYTSPSVTEFSLESGADQLAPHFTSVERFERESELRVPDLEPLVAYAASLPDSDREALDAFADLAAAELADGPFTIAKSMGLFVAGKAD